MRTAKRQRYLKVSFSSFLFNPSLYSKCLKSKLEQISDALKLCGFQTVWFSDTFFIRMCLKSEIVVQILDTTYSVMSEIGTILFRFQIPFGSKNLTHKSSNFKHPVFQPFSACQKVFYSWDLKSKQVPFWSKFLNGLN